MSGNDAAELGVLEAAATLRARKLSAAELTEACLQRIEERNGGAPSFDGAPDAINAWVRIYADRAREDAAAADTQLAAAARASDDSASLLCGIPLALKDLYAVKGLPLTASSRVLEGNVADHDSVAWTRLRDQGMVLIGHTHTHEFAAGGTTDQVGNPRDVRRVAGGSSGGSAAALAAGMVPAALGTDTCGSLRIPSACCGTSVIKASHGRVPLEGIIPLAPTLDHAGPMARSIADCAALLNALMAGGAETLPYAPPAAPPATLPITARADPKPLTGLKIALTERTESTPLDAAVAAALDSAAKACEQLGARIVRRPPAWTPEWSDLTLVLMTDAWVYHRHRQDRHDLYRPAIAEFMEVAKQFTNAVPYLEAQQRRAAGARTWDAWFEEFGVDLVLEPTLPIVPYARGTGYERGHAGGPGDPMIALTSLWDLTGMPVASLPVTWEASVSLIARRGYEQPLTQVAIDLQQHALGVPT